MGLAHIYPADHDTLHIAGLDPFSGQNAIIGWRSKVPWRNDLQVEQDLILHAMIHAIYSDPFLQKKIALRGGTCLNKFVWDTPARYSEDLDFVQITPEKIGPTADRLRSVLKNIFEEEGKSESKRGSFKLFYSFAPENNPNHRQRIKIEINTRDQFAIDGYRKIKITLDSLWRKGEAAVTTFSAEELFATKLRALYQRRKGRDLFDLWMSQGLGLNYKKIVHLFLEYMEHNKKKVHHDLLIQNLDDKIKDQTFLDDVSALLVHGVGYDPLKAADFVKKELFSLVPESKSKAKRGLNLPRGQPAPCHR